MRFSSVSSSPAISKDTFSSFDPGLIMRGRCNEAARLSSSDSNPDPLHLIEAEFLAPAIIQLRRARAGMVRHLRRLFQRAAVFQIGRDSGCPETVVAQPGRNAGRRRTSADNGIRVPLGQ